MIFHERAIVTQHHAWPHERAHRLGAAGVPLPQVVKRRQARCGEGVARLRIAQLGLEFFAVELQRFEGADHQAAIEPQRGIRKDLEKGPHDEQVVGPFALADPLHRDAAGLERLPDELEVFLRIQAAGARMNRLNDVGGDDIETFPRQQQKVPSIVDAHAHVGTIEDVVVDVGEVGGGLADAVGELDDLHRGAGVLADRSGRGAPTQAYDQGLARIRMQCHRKDADLAVDLDHALRVVGLMQTTDAEHALELRFVDADGGLRAFLAEHFEDAGPDAVTRGGDVGVRQARGHDAAQGDHDRQWQPGGHPALQQRDGEARDGEDPRHGHQTEPRAQPGQQQESSGE